MHVRQARLHSVSLSVVRRNIPGIESSCCLSTFVMYLLTFLTLSTTGMEDFDYNSDDGINLEDLIAEYRDLEDRIADGGYDTLSSSQAKLPQLPPFLKKYQEITRRITK